MDRRFDRIDFWATGDKPATKWFTIILEHLTNELGIPKSNEKINDGDQLAIWELGNLDIKLHLYEQHAYRTNFRIEKK